MARLIWSSKKIKINLNFFLNNHIVNYFSFNLQIIHIAIIDKNLLFIYIVDNILGFVAFLKKWCNRLIRVKQQNIVSWFNKVAI